MTVLKFVIVFIVLFSQTLFVSSMQTVSAQDEETKARWESQKTKDRELWNARTVGENLALGKTVQLIPKPDYRLTVRGDSDSTDLTDGVLSTAPWDRLWFDSKSVGWYFADGLERFVRLDLGQIQPIERVVIRCLGGSGHNFRFPKQFEVWVSRDGREWFQAASMQKLMPCEASQCDWDRYYYLEESGETYETRTFPFELNVEADARFILLKITGATASVFSDELAVMKVPETKEDSQNLQVSQDAQLSQSPQDPQNPPQLRNPSARFNAAYSGTARSFPLEGVILSTRWPELGIVRGMQIPQHFQMMDLRPTDREAETAASQQVEMVLEIPNGIGVSAGNPAEIPAEWQNVTGEALPLGEDGAKYARFVFPLAEKNGTFALPTLYFSVQEEESRPFPPVRLYARCGGEPQFQTTLPVRVETLPEFEPFTQLHVSLAWMGEKEQKSWPNFFTNYRKLGFNAVPTFPRYWPKEDEKIASNLDFTAEARRQGFRIVMNESPLHVMMGGKAEGDEIFCQTPEKPGKNLCPTYRGEAYEREMNRVAQCVQRVRPDFVFFDIECWHTALSSAKTCTRCQNAFQNAQKSEPDLTLETFLFRQGREITRDLHDAVVRGAKDAQISVPIIGSYNRQPTKPVYAIERFDETYPESLDLAMPSLYVAGRERDVHENIRQNCGLLGNSDLIPWLSAGCYGEFDPSNLEFMVLEAFLNGSCGVTYYCFTDFDTPLDFYAHAKALAQLRPCETLLVQGKPLDFSGSCPQMLYSALGTDSECLLLVGNPDGADPEIHVSIPLKTSESGKNFRVRDLQSGEETVCSAGVPWSFCVEKGKVRLFHVQLDDESEQ